MLKMNKEYPGWERDWRSTKKFVVVCTTHQVTLRVNENYAFARSKDGVVWEFDEDVVDTSGMSCPADTDENDVDCSENWEAMEIDGPTPSVPLTSQKLRRIERVVRGSR